MGERAVTSAGSAFEPERPLESREVDLIVDRLREMIAPQLIAGRPPIRTMSRAVAMSVRTLQRRLAERGWSYSELVDDVRRAVARRRVEHPQTPFNVVAADLGFAEQASFTRAFRRWTGLTPRAYRRLRGPSEAGRRARSPVGGRVAPRERYRPEPQPPAAPPLRLTASG